MIFSNIFIIQKIYKKGQKVEFLRIYNLESQNQIFRKYTLRNEGPRNLYHLLHQKYLWQWQTQEH